MIFKVILDWLDWAFVAHTYSYFLSQVKLVTEEPIAVLS